MDNEDKLKDTIRDLKIMVILLLFVVIAFSVGLFRGEVTYNELIGWPKSGYVQIIMILVFISPAIFGFIKFNIQRFIFVVSVYLDKQPTYKLWADIRRLDSIMNQEDYVEYYRMIREQYGEHTLDRIIRKDFKKGDSMDIIILSLGYPQFAIHYYPWPFIKRDNFYYFPFYNQKRIYSIFNIKYKYKFVFQNDKLIKVSMDDNFKIDKYDPSV